MNTLVLQTDATNPDVEAIRRAAEVIRAGGLVAFPTETVYGLGANALDAAAAARIFASKERPATNPLIVHIADVHEVLNVAAAWPETAAKLAAKFWPGPLTLVLPKNEAVPEIVTAGGPTVAVRWPAHRVAQALIRAAGVPIAAPSANRSTELSPTRADHVLKSLNGRIDVLLDGGACSGGIESTVVDATGDVPRILRPGLVTVPMLEAVVGRVESASGGREPPVGAPARSPGQMEKHYSPKTPLVLGDTALDAYHRARELIRNGLRVVVWMPNLFWLKDYPLVADEPARASVKEMPSQPDECAAALYDALHEFDAMNLDQIVIGLPPDAPEWAGVRDRLVRAASK